MRFNFIRDVATFMTLGAFLAGCSENMISEPEAPLEKDTDFYINVKIATPSETDTRTGDKNETAGNYENGTPAEQEIKEILFVFYNSDYQYVGNATHVPGTGEMTSQTTTDGGTTTPISGSIESILKFTVPVTVAAGSTKPAYVMAYVNPTKKATDDLLNDYYTALGAFRELDDVLPGGTVKGGFTMNNSVHYEEENDDELPTIAISLTEGAGLYTSLEEAQKPDATSVIIYVERVVAKVTMDEIAVVADKITENTVEDSDGTRYTLDFDVKGWGLSNLERRTFLVKNFREEKYKNPDPNKSGFDNPLIFRNFAYKALNDRLNNAEDETRSLTNPSWNFNVPSSTTDNWSKSGHRTFWALSPSYYHNKELFFPAYADEIYGEGKAKNDDGNDKKSALVYRTFNDIYDVTNSKIGRYGVENKAGGSTQYTLEHTMQAGMVTDYQKRAVTCAVVVGKYTLKSNNTDVTYDNFYLRKIMTDSGIKNIIYPSDDAMKKEYLKNNSTLYIKNPSYTVGGTEKEYIPVPFESGETKNEYYADFVIEHPYIAESPVPSRYVTLKLNDITKHTYYYQNAEDAFVDVKSADLPTVNSALYNNLIGMLGGIEEYHQGYAYFEIPVRHLWGTSNGDIGSEGFAAQLGQYGIVRNHAYNIKVTAIKGIGIGISDPEAPIVPNIENDNYSVKTEIRVQRWRMVPTQEVTLKP